MAVTKRQLDNYFNNNYYDILKLTQNIINKLKKKYEPETLLANGYIYLKNKQSDIPEEEDIQRWLITYIKNEIKWTNSQISKEEKIKDNIEINDYHQENDDSDIQDKIDYELRYNKEKDILNQYRNDYLKDKQRQIIFDIYFLKGHSSSRKMGRHFNIHYVSAWKLINEMKEDIYYFINNVYNNNNNIK